MAQQTINVDLIKKPHIHWLLKEKEWRMIQDCIIGEPAIKAGREIYLQFPIPIDDKKRKSDKFKKHYEVYLEGAHFVNYTEQAVEDLVSGCFRKDIVADIPAVVDYLNVDEIARDCVRDVTAFGRVFLLADYPSVEAQPTIADEQKLGLAAFMCHYNPLQVINWTSKIVNGLEVPTRVVITDTDEEGTYWKELVVEGGVYIVRIHRENINGLMFNTETIVKANGKTLDHIPGIFIGSISNTCRIDRIPVLGIARSNIKHYQTWAELMHVQTYGGHPQVVVSGLPNGWLKAAEEQNKRSMESGDESAPAFNFGASNVLALEGETSKAEVLNLATDNIIHFKTLEQLEKSMLEQGARIKAFHMKNGVESNAALITRSSGESSQLAKIATNCERAIKFAIDECALFMGDAGASAEIEINKEFFEPVADPAMVTILNATIGAGNLPRVILWDYLRSVNIISDDVTDEQLSVDLEQTSSGLSRSAFGQNSQSA